MRVGAAGACPVPLAALGDQAAEESVCLSDVTFDPIQ
jgi:hypothetical protein